MTQEVIKIRGGQTLKGRYDKWCQNSAVAIIPATLLAQGQVKLDGTTNFRCRDAS